MKRIVFTLLLISPILLYAQTRQKLIGKISIETKTKDINPHIQTSGSTTKITYNEVLLTIGEETYHVLNCSYEELNPSPNGYTQQQQTKRPEACYDKTDKKYNGRFVLIEGNVVGHKIYSAKTSLLDDTQISTLLNTLFQKGEIKDKLILQTQ